MSAKEGPPDQEDGTIRIPIAKFIDSVDDYLSSSGASADEAIKQLNHDYQIYKSVEQQLLHKKTRLLAKVPDLHRALDMVKMLKAKAGDEVTIDYSLAEQVHATAKLKDVSSVKLWLGADVMLEYELDEAITVLEENLELAKKSLEINKKDLELMKDYVTTTEVSMARIYNHDVARRKQGGKQMS